MDTPRLVTVAGVAITSAVGQVTANAQDKMYWTDLTAKKIQRANRDGTKVADLVTGGLLGPKGIALDLEAGRIYWADSVFANGKIRCADLDGANVEDLVTVERFVDDVALDPVGRKMYWTSSSLTDARIQRADLDGSNVEDLVTTGLESPDGIALDVARRKMYWTEPAASKIQRADLNGSNVEDLVTTGLQRPGGIALDLLGGKIYWCDSSAGKIQRADLDGSNTEELVTTVGPFGIALDLRAGKMYWTDTGADQIRRANLDGSDIEQLVTTPPGLPFDIALDVPPFPMVGIPTVSEWGLAALGAMFLASASVIITRRRPARARYRCDHEKGYGASHPLSRTGKGTLSSKAMFCALGVSLALNAAVNAQPASAPIEIVAVNFDSGVVSASGGGSNPVVVFSNVLAVPGAPWVRLHFEQVQLTGSPSAGDESFLRITSLADGDVQTLNASALTRWGNTSAYFTGDEVLVELLASPETGANRVKVDKVAVGVSIEQSGAGTSASGPVDNCETDDRQTSTDPRAGRLRWFRRPAPPIGCVEEQTCTAFLVNGRPNWFLSAGHCCGAPFFFSCAQFPPVVEFNVPPSDTCPGTICPAPAEDQYCVDPDSVQPSTYQDAGVGDDWCLFGTFENTDTGLSPLEAQGGSYRLPRAVPTADGSTLRMTGYGNDDDPALNGTQQTDAGPYEQLDGTIVTYLIYTVGGTSGSPVEHECRGMVYAVHTHGFCEESSYNANAGTAINHPELVDALVPNEVDGGTREPLGVCADCNGNEILDKCDVDCAGPGCAPPCGGSSDCNINGIPDECEPDDDCQPNGTRDICDLATGISQDLNGNTVPDECEGPMGACCMSDSSCYVLLGACCTGMGTTYVGDGTTCSPAGACCIGDGSCRVTTQACCTGGGGSFLGTGATCDVGQGACCLPDRCCVDTTPSWCQQQGGSFFSSSTCQALPFPHGCPFQQGPSGA